jgi:hypothetical protein
VQYVAEARMNDLILGDGAEPVRLSSRFNDEQGIHKISITSLLIRAAPLITSVFFFIGAAVADAKTWGNRGLQALLAIGLVLFVIGIALFIPNRKR